MRAGLASALEISARILRESTSFDEAERALEAYRGQAAEAVSKSPTEYSYDFMDTFIAVLGILYQRRLHE
jgi:hypothetical protein